MPIFFRFPAQPIPSFERNQFGASLGERERERLRQLEADLTHVKRVSTLGELAAPLAHEIKQPLAATIASANTCIEWLAHEPPNLERARAEAARIDRYWNRATEIIDRMRSFYRKSPPKRELVEVNQVIDEILALLKSQATGQSVNIRTELTIDLPKTIADRVQLQQVFMNLMLNAIEAMQDSGGANGEVTTAGWSASVLGERHGRGIAN